MLSLRKKARLADTLIAQLCLDHQLPLITRDSDFKILLVSPASNFSKQLNQFFGAMKMQYIPLFIYEGIGFGVKNISTVFLARSPKEIACLSMANSFSVLS